MPASPGGRGGILTYLARPPIHSRFPVTCLLPAMFFSCFLRGLIHDEVWLKLHFVAFIPRFVIAFSILGCTYTPRYAILIHGLHPTLVLRTYSRSSAVNTISTEFSTDLFGVLYAWAYAALLPPRCWAWSAVGGADSQSAVFTPPL